MRSKGWLRAVALLAVNASGLMYAQLDPATLSVLQVSPASTLFQQSVTNGICELAPTCGVKFTPVVPGTRLVITYFNASTYSSPITSPNLVVSTLSGAKGNVVKTFLHTGPASGNGNSYANASTLMYFDAGETPAVPVDNASGLLSIRVTLSGYVMHVP